MGPFLAAGEVLAESRKGRRDKSSNGEEGTGGGAEEPDSQSHRIAMKGSLRLNSLWLRVLLYAAQACVYETAPVCTNYERAWGAALRAAQETGSDLTLSIGLEVSSLGPGMAST